MGIFGKKKVDKKDEEKRQETAAFKDVSNKKEEKASMKDLYAEDDKSRSSAEAEFGIPTHTSGKPAVQKEGKVEKTKKKAKFNEAYRVLIKPLITEKAAKMGEQSKYAFAIDVKANKIMVAKAIEQAYGVKPINVNIINVRGKTVRTGRISGKRKNWKKAIVTLPAGKSIQIYEGV